MDLGEAGDETVDERPLCHGGSGRSGAGETRGSGVAGRDFQASGHFAALSGTAFRQAAPRRSGRGGARAGRWLPPVAQPRRDPRVRGDGGGRGNRERHAYRGGGLGRCVGVAGAIADQPAVGGTFGACLCVPAPDPPVGCDPQRDAPLSCRARDLPRGR
ncbi:UNVERIFIED_CONTAM: hypothetical protein NCL1_03105 [Trichonephila clavipes]